MPNSNDKESFIKRLTEIIHTNITNEQFGVNELAKELGMSRSNLHRKVTAFTGKSVSTFISDIKLDKATHLLKESSSTISEIAFECGFQSTTYFSKCFKDRYGFPPGEVRNHMNEVDSQEENSLQMESRRKPAKSISIYYFLATSLILLLTIALIVWKPFQKTEEPADKSIAVLPFINDSPDETEMYFINGTMEAILDNLCKIADLRVPGRMSVEQYREHPKSIQTVAKEMNVSYILEGSGQKIGERILLSVQLLDGIHDQHLWSKQYDRKIQHVEDLIDIQSEVAKLVAAEIKAIITHEEKKIIEKAPTISLTAYDFYQRGREEHQSYRLNGDRRALERAEDLYHRALEYDSSFAQAYTGLAKVFWNKYYWDTYLSENFLDSALILTDIALSLDNQLSEAYVIRGDYYKDNNKKEQAINEYDQAIKFNPNDWMAYYQKGMLYYHDDLVNSIDNIQKAASLHKGPLLPEIYRRLGIVYNHAGFKQKANYYVEEALKLDDDSAAYFGALAEIEDGIGNFKKAIEFGEKSYAIDSTDWWVIFLLGIDHMFLGHNERFLDYITKYQDRLKTLNNPHPWGIIKVGYAYWINGFREEATSYFNTALEFYDELIELDRFYILELHTYYNLATLHAFLGEKEEAYENLRVMNQCKRMPLWMIKEINNDPLFDSIRDEPDFQRIARDVEAKYQAEHERVRQWLEDNDML
jgi:TolB-like protein/AraC-like DNA-binding protein